MVKYYKYPLILVSDEMDRDDVLSRWTSGAIR